MTEQTPASKRAAWEIEFKGQVGPNDQQVNRSGI